MVRIAWTKLNEWMERGLWLAVFGILVGVFTVIWLLMPFNRTPPISWPADLNIELHAGEWNEIILPVRRDLSRHCEATSSWTLRDADGSRFVLAAQIAVSDADIRDMEANYPGQIKRMVLIPPMTGVYKGIDPGPGALTNTLVYRCNFTQAIWPITVSRTIPAIVQ